MPCFVQIETLAACENVKPPMPVSLDKDLGRVFKFVLRALKSCPAVIFASVTDSSALL